mgnify:CR=1 FL=1
MPRRKPWFYAPGPEEVAERAAKARADKAAERFGVFPNMYRSGAVKVYKRRTAAEAYAERLNNADPAANMVVRPMR